MGKKKNDDLLKKLYTENLELKERLRKLEEQSEDPITVEPDPNTDVYTADELYEYLQGNHKAKKDSARIRAETVAELAKAKASSMRGQAAMLLDKFAGRAGYDRYETEAYKKIIRDGDLDTVKAIKEDLDRVAEEARDEEEYRKASSTLADMFACSLQKNFGYPEDDHLWHDPVTGRRLSDMMGRLFV